ncbi:Rod shape-determining protein MreC [Enterococcus faecalis KS19]|nr:Rod shape-determining protein MreC [Enterococcus faecalis KS19]
MRKKSLTVIPFLIVLVLVLGLYTYYSLEYSNKIIKIYKENLRLEEKVESIDQLTNEIQNNKRMLTFLKKEKEFQRLYSKEELVVANVVQRDISNWSDSLWIDKGEEEDLEVGMTVLSNAGIIGQISTVLKEKSKVNLVTSSKNYSNNSFSVRFQNDTEDVLGLLDGYDEASNELNISRVMDIGQVKNGDVVTTSGIGGKTISGLPVGTVTHIESSETFLDKKVTVRPYADFDDILFVTVIKNAKNL